MDRQKFGQAFVPYHPGAIRYYREIGVWSEEAEMQNRKNLRRQFVLQQAWEKFLPSAPEDYTEFELSWLISREQALADAEMITLGEGL